jgi:excisionase family DNA binding protein
MLPDILTLEQAAEYLQLPPDEVRNELEQERLPGIKIAGQWRIKRAALDKLFESSQSLEQPALQARKTEPSPVAESIEQQDISPDKVEPEFDDQLTSAELVEQPQQVETTTTPSDIPPKSNGSAQHINQLKENNPIPSDKVTEQPGKMGASSLSKDSISPIHQFSQSDQRFRGDVFAYNAKQRFGYARLADNSVVWISPDHFLNQNYIPQLGDKISFEVEHTRKGRQARNICLVEDEESFITGTNVPAAKEVTAPENMTRAQLKESIPSYSFSVSPKEKSVPPLPVPKQTPPRSGTLRAQEFYQKAAVARTEGYIDEALRLFRQVLEAGAGISMYEAFVKMLNELGYKQEAKQVIQQAINTFPDHADFYVIYGQMERKSWNYTLAEEIFRQGLRLAPANQNLQMALAPVLVQKGTEESLKEAGQIYEELAKRGLYISDSYYQRYKAFQRSPRTNKAYEFFQECQMEPGITDSSDLPKGIIDLVVDIQLPEFSESFGLSDAALVRCFGYNPRQADLVELQKYLRSFGPQDILVVQDGRRFVINKLLAFIAVANSDLVRDHVMNILSENGEAIVPLDDAQLKNLDNPLQVLRDVLGQYLGSRDLYSGHLPVSGRRFFGREKLLRELADRIQMGQFLGIYGLRKMGKTSLLYQLRDQKLRTEAVAYVDLQKSAALSEKNCNPLYWELERDLYQRLSKPYPDLADLLRLGKIPRFSDLPDQGQRARLLFDEDIRALLDKIQEGEASAIKRLVIVLDELEWILPIGQERVEGYLEFFGLLRGLTQTERYRGLISSIVVAANASISERGYWEGRENPVFAFYSPIFLPPFTFDECSEMISSLGKNMSVYWSDEALDKIFSETGGHPFLTRLFCSHIVNEYHTRPLTVTFEMVNAQLIPFMRGQGDKFMQITELLRQNFSDEEKFLEQIALDESPSYLSDEALRHLLGYQLIHLEGERYQITLNLLRRWLRHRAGVRD